MFALSQRFEKVDAPAFDATSPEAFQESSGNRTAYELRAWSAAIMPLQRGPLGGCECRAT